MHPLFSPLHSSAHCPTTSTSQHPNLTWATHSRLPEPLTARHRPVDRPSHGALHALEGQAQGGKLTESIEQVDLHRVNGLTPPHKVVTASLNSYIVNLVSL